MQRRLPARLRIELNGFDKVHRVQKVRFEDVVVDGQPLVAADVKTNAFVTDVTVQP